MISENKKLVLAGLEENGRRYGMKLCPCVPRYIYDNPLEIDLADYACPCLEYRTKGICRCGLFDNKLEEKKEIN